MGVACDLHVLKLETDHNRLCLVQTHWSFCPPGTSLILSDASYHFPPQPSQVTESRSGWNLWSCGCPQPTVSSTASSTSGSTEASAGSSAAWSRGSAWCCVRQSAGGWGARHRYRCTWWLESGTTTTPSRSDPPVCHPHAPCSPWLLKLTSEPLL